MTVKFNFDFDYKNFMCENYYLEYKQIVNTRFKNERYDVVAVNYKDDKVVLINDNNCFEQIDWLFLKVVNN